jgi:hypothetical protein
MGMNARCLAALALIGCIPVLPPVNPGFVAIAPRPEGGTDFGAQIGGAALCGDSCTGYTGASLHVEPWTGPEVSVPIDGAVTWFPDGMGVFVPLRVGFRYHPGSGLAVGAGLGPNFSMMGPDYTDVGYASVIVGGAVDIEAALGTDLSGGALSVAIRPGYAFSVWVPQAGDSRVVNAFMLPLEAAGVIDVSDGLGLGASLVVGLGVTQDTALSSFGGTIMVVTRPRGTKPPP